MENKIHTNRKYNIKLIQTVKWDGMGGEISATDNAILVCRQNALIYAYICACVRLMGQASYIKGAIARVPRTRSVMCNTIQTGSD